MVVAPYNAQVRCLREALPDGVRVGTVDKFQGQEAAAVCFFALGRLSLTETRSDTTELVARKGDEHEQTYLAGLRADGREVVEIKSEPGLEGTREGAKQTIEAMKAGAEVIYQGVLFDGFRWRGHCPAWPLPPIAATWGTRRWIRVARRVVGADAIQMYTLIARSGINSVLGIRRGWG